MKIFASLALLLVLPATVAHAQQITAVEFTFERVDNPGQLIRTTSLPATSYACQDGRAIKLDAPVWLKPTESIKVQFEPDATRVCTATLPIVETAAFAPGTLFVARAAFVNEAGLKGDASPTSNPFGVAGPPNAIQSLTVTK